MLDMPRQDWAFYEALTRKENARWLRSLSLSDRFTLYEDLFNVIWTARRQVGHSDRLDRWSWEQKLATRRRLVDAFTKLDQFRRERAAAE
jgi:hypothetical protein